MQGCGCRNDIALSGEHKRVGCNEGLGPHPENAHVPVQECLALVRSQSGLPASRNEGDDSTSGHLRAKRDGVAEAWDWTDGLARSRWRSKNVDLTDDLILRCGFL